jgi:hypothetical protein
MDNRVYEKRIHKAVKQLYEQLSEMGCHTIVVAYAGKDIDGISYDGWGRRGADSCAYGLAAKIGAEIENSWMGDIENDSDDNDGDIMNLQNNPE